MKIVIQYSYLMIPLLFYDEAQCTTVIKIFEILDFFKMYTSARNRHFTTYS